MSQLTRKQLLQRSESTIEAEKLVYQLEDDKLQLEADLRETNRALTSKNRELLQLKSAPKLSPTSIVEVTGEIESLEKGIQILEDLIAELFPGE